MTIAATNRRAADEALFAFGAADRSAGITKSISGLGGRARLLGVVANLSSRIFESSFLLRPPTNYASTLICRRFSVNSEGHSNVSLNLIASCAVDETILQHKVVSIIVVILNVYIQGQ